MCVRTRTSVDTIRERVGGNWRGGNEGGGVFLGEKRGRVKVVSVSRTLEKVKFIYTYALVK